MVTRYNRIKAYFVLVFVLEMILIITYLLQGILADDDSIYMSLGEIPISTS